VPVAAVAIIVVAWIVVGKPFAKGPVTKAEIEREVAKKPHSGKVQVVLCNEVFVPSQQAESDPPDTWTCDTYLGPTPREANNGPSYQVIVDKGRIKSIRHVATH